MVVARVLTGTRIFVAVAALIATQVNATTMYKWVDENGEVHFSQTPPINTDNNDVSYQQLDSGELTGSVIRPTTIGDRARCGDLQLPGKKRLKSMSAGSLNQQINSWNRSLRDAEQRLNQFLSRNSKYKTSSSFRKSGSFSKELDRYQRPVHEYRCAIQWAKGHIAAVRERSVQTNREIERVQKKIDVATATLFGTCGNEPAKYTQSGTYNQRHRSWKKCTQKHGGALRELRQELRNLKRNSY